MYKIFFTMDGGIVLTKFPVIVTVIFMQNLRDKFTQPLISNRVKKFYKKTLNHFTAFGRYLVV